MMQRDKVINTIKLAYQKPSSGEDISEEEIRNYIRSVGFLEDILLFSRTAFLVVDCKRWIYLYSSSNTKQVLGWEPEEFLEGGPLFGLTRLDPRDLEIQASIHPFMVDFVNNLPDEKKNKYKFSFTSRLTHKNGKEVNLLQNNFFLKPDADGQPHIKLITFTDISAYKKDDRVIFYITKLGHTGKNEIVLQKCFSGDDEISLTARELTVLRDSASGLSNAAIARKLNISYNTIKNHKKNILRKLGCSNTSAMIALAALYGLLSSQRFGKLQRKIGQYR